MDANTATGETPDGVESDNLKNRTRRIIINKEADKPPFFRRFKSQDEENETRRFVELADELYGPVKRKD